MNITTELKRRAASAFIGRGNLCVPENGRWNPRDAEERPRKNAEDAEGAESAEPRLPRVSSDRTFCPKRPSGNKAKPEGTEVAEATEA